MPSKLASCVIGIDVGGTNTDSVILQGDEVLGWNKTTTTPDIQEGVQRAIKAVVDKANIQTGQVESVRIGTTQFVNAVLEQDSSKLDRVAVIRLCGPYSKGSPPFVDFPPKLRNLVEGHFGYVDGGYQVDGSEILPVNEKQLREQASYIKAKSIRTVVLIGIYSPSNPKQEIAAKEILESELGPGYDISCSYAIGRLGFLERENASILNASLRRFARHVIAGFYHAVNLLNLERCKLYITLNDGTLSKAADAAEYPVRCFRSGPTNSATGAALLAMPMIKRSKTENTSDEKEILVIDVGGTTTDICALLKTGYPRQSAAFGKIGGVRTNYTIPDVYSIGLGGGSHVLVEESGTTVGPKSVGANLERDSIANGGEILTASDLVAESLNDSTLISLATKSAGLEEIKRKLEAAIDLVKTKQGDAIAILVGGGSVIIQGQLAGVAEIIRPQYLEVANAIGAAIAKVSGSVEKVILPGRTMDEEILDATNAAIKLCIAAGGNKNTIKTVEIETIPVSYSTNGATQIFVRVVGEVLQGSEGGSDVLEISNQSEAFRKEHFVYALPNGFSEELSSHSKGSTDEIEQQVDLVNYRPKIVGDLWYISEIDLQFLQDGTGVLGVGSCGEPYPAYVACRLALANQEELTIRRQDTLPDDSVVLVAGFMGSPSVYLERIPGLDEVAEAIKVVMRVQKISAFDAVIPNEIGGMNSFEALLAAQRFSKSVLDTDLVARAYPKLWQTVRCLQDIPITPAAVANGPHEQETFVNLTNEDTETVMRDACTKLGSLSGICVNPVYGVEAKTLPRNSFSHAWSIGREIALARARKEDPITRLLQSENGVLLFTGKIISVSRKVGEGFTRGDVILEPFSEDASSHSASTSLIVDFENENLSAILRSENGSKVLACCPDLIVFLDKANGAPLGISDYKYGLRVSVIALRAPPVWASKRGLEMGGPKAFGLDMEYVPVGGENEYTEPRSVWERFPEVPEVE